MLLVGGVAEVGAGHGAVEGGVGLAIGEVVEVDGVGV